MSITKQVLSYAGKYAASHWAYRVDPGFIIRKYFSAQLPSGVYMVHYVNPSDRNGYRSILKLFSDDVQQLESLWNRPATADEYSAIFSVAGTICQYYSKLGLVPQVLMLGNNSQQCVDGQAVLGNDKEPYFLHLHFYGRGVSSQEYIPGLQLGGKDIGTDVELRSKTSVLPADTDIIRGQLGYADTFPHL